ncbi:hypothetical protein SBADM41S_02996 [Streptomyces badius]
MSGTSQYATNSPTANTGTDTIRTQVERSSWEVFRAQPQAEYVERQELEDALDLERPVGGRLKASRGGGDRQGDQHRRKRTDCQQGVDSRQRNRGGQEPQQPVGRQQRERVVRAFAARSKSV